MTIAPIFPFNSFGLAVKDQANSIPNEGLLKNFPLACHCPP